MARNRSDTDLHGGRLRVPRTRGALSGFLLILLGAWGALVPLIGPYANFGYTPDRAWAWSSARFWLEILPGAAVVLGGLLLLLAADRITTSIGGWIAAAGGAWFIVGPALAALLHLGAVGTPLGTSTSQRAAETLALFSGLGAVILFLSAGALGRLAVVGVRDVRAAQRRAERDREEADARAQANRAAHSDPPVERPVDTGPSERIGRAGDTARTEPTARPGGRPTDGTGATRIEP